MDLRAREGGGEELRVGAGGAVEEVPVVPERPVRAVPEEHLHMELAVLWWGGECMRIDIKPLLTQPLFTSPD